MVSWIWCIIITYMHDSLIPQQSQSLGESYPVPAQALPAYKTAKGRATEVPPTIEMIVGGGGDTDPSSLEVGYTNKVEVVNIHTTIA